MRRRKKVLFLILMKKLSRYKKPEFLQHQLCFINYIKIAEQENCTKISSESLYHQTVVNEEKM